jgi:hypothetical protein
MPALLHSVSLAEGDLETFTPLGFSPNVFGCILVVIGSTISGVGNNVQKRYHNMKAAGQTTDKNYWNAKVWWLGMGMVTLGAVLDFFAYGIAVQVQLSSTCCS